MLIAKRIGGVLVLIVFSPIVLLGALTAAVVDTFGMGVLVWQNLCDWVAGDL